MISFGSSILGVGFGVAVGVGVGVGDFAAWFEVYLGGGWRTFDARNNVPRIGRVLLARGRDATDVAIATTFGPKTLESFKVWTDEVAETSSVSRPFVH